MSDLQPVTYSRHGDQHWLRVTGYAFAARDTAAPLVAHEMHRAVLSLATAFARQEERFVLVAVQGLASGHNLLVAGDGRWLGGYVPAVYRSYPFRLARTEDGNNVLCVDEGSGLVVGDTSRGEAFFSADGEVAQPLAEVMEFLSQLRAAHDETERACKSLQEHDLLRPWQIQLKASAGRPRKLQGLFRIDEAALNALPAAALAALRDAGALKLAYGQLLSMQHLPMLARLAQEGRSATTPGLPLTPEGDLDLDFMNRGGTISFGNLG